MVRAFDLSGEEAAGGAMTASGEAAIATEKLEKLVTLASNQRRFPS